MAASVAHCLYRTLRRDLVAEGFAAAEGSDVVSIFRGGIDNAGGRLHIGVNGGGAGVFAVLAGANDLEARRVHRFELVAIQGGCSHRHTWHEIAADRIRPIGANALSGVIGKGIRVGDTLSVGSGKVTDV